MQKNKNFHLPFKKFSLTLINKHRFTSSSAMKNRVIKAIQQHPQQAQLTQPHQQHHQPIQQHQPIQGLS